MLLKYLHAKNYDNPQYYIVNSEEQEKEILKMELFFTEF